MTILKRILLTPLAQVFRNSGYDITAVMSVLLKSDHFFNMAYSSACLIKSPLDFVLGLMREFQVKMPDPSDYGSCYSAWEMILQTTATVTTGNSAYTGSGGMVCLL